MATQTLPIDLLNDELKLSLLLQRYRPITITEMSKALSEALDNIQMTLIKTEDLTQRARLKYLEKQIIDELGTAYKIMPSAIQQDMADVAETAYMTTSSALLTHGATQIVFSDLPKNAIKEIIDMNSLVLLDGKGYKISDFVDNQLDSHTKRFKQIVAAGIAEGATTSTIARRLKEVNTKVKRNDLQAIARTVVSEARGRGQSKAFEVADDITTGWQSIGTLDSKTSLRCAALDGKIWHKSQGWTTEKLKAKNYWYPRHFNCRSVVIPRTVLSDKLDEDRTRASQDGQVPAKTSFQEFFDSQDDSFKRDYLGGYKYDLYKQNKLQIKDFVDIKSGREFTIGEIGKKLGYHVDMQKESAIFNHFRKKDKDKDGFYIIGSTDEVISKTLDSSSKNIVISIATIEKNIIHHTDLDIDSYNILDKIAGKYDILFKDGTHTSGIIHNEFGDYYYALKATKTGETVFLTSFRKTSDNDIQRLKNKLRKGKIEIIKGEL